MYRGRHDEIDLVLLDIVMPKMGGGQAFDCIKAINPDVKVLLLSGYSIDGEATQILERGCSGFIQKPFNMPRIQSAGLQADLYFRNKHTDNVYQGRLLHQRFAA